MWEVFLLKERTRTGFWVSLIFGLWGLLGTFYVFVIRDHWHDTWVAKAGNYSEALGINRLDEVFIIKYMFPAFHDLAAVGGVLMLVAAYMFWKKYSKAWHVGVAGSLIAVQGTFFSQIASASAGIFPWYTIVALPNLLAFFLYITIVRKFPGKAIAFAALNGMMFVLALMNGVASASRMSQKSLLSHINYPDHIGVPENLAMFASVQQLNWVGMIAWGVFLLGFLYRKKWILPIGVGAAILNIIGGMPLGIDSMMDGSIFSLFLLGPIFAITILTIILTKRGSKFLIGDWEPK